MFLAAQFGCFLNNNLLASENIFLFIKQYLLEVIATKRNAKEESVVKS